MQIDDSGDRPKLWLTRDEYHTVRRKLLEQHGAEGELLAEFGGTLMMRSQSYPVACYKHVRRSKNGYMMKVVEKDTTGGEPKTRHTYLPDDLEEQLYKYKTDNDLNETEPFLDKSNRTLRRWIKKAGQALAEEDGRPEEWAYLSSHDLRRHAAHYYLVSCKRNPRHIMAQGGWDSFQAIEPYLSKPTEENIINEMQDVDF